MHNNIMCFALLRVAIYSLHSPIEYSLFLAGVQTYIHGMATADFTQCSVSCQNSRH